MFDDSVFEIPDSPVIAPAEPAERRLRLVVGGAAEAAPTKTRRRRRSLLVIAAAWTLALIATAAVAFTVPRTLHWFGTSRPPHSRIAPSPERSGHDTPVASTDASDATDRPARGGRRPAHPRFRPEPTIRTPPSLATTAMAATATRKGRTKGTRTPAEPEKIKAKTKVAIRAERWRRAGQDEQGQDEQGQDEQGQDEQGQDEQGQDEQGQDEQGQDEQGQDEQGQDEQGQDEQGQDEQGRVGQDELVGRDLGALAARSSRHPSRSRNSETAVPSTNDQKNGPRPKRVMSESAIANAKIGPYVSGP